MKIFKHISILLLVAAIIGNPTESIAQTHTVQREMRKEVPASVDKAVMLQLVNEVRKKGYQCGDTYYYPAPPLTWNDKLEAAAYLHSADMAKNRYFSHRALDGTRGGNRIERAGYAWKTFGENIGQGFKTEKEMLKGWLESPGHCKNIMSKSYKEVGVGRVGTLWTQAFGSR